MCSGSVASALQTSAAYNVIMKMFDFTLLLSPSYLVLCFGGVLPFLGKLSYIIIIIIIIIADIVVFVIRGDAEI